jgi:LytS/YehU family sensor histidine kinase
MQHWVDSKDDRAGPMLQHLTRFLRQSVTALDKPTGTLAEELDLVRPYLAIMAARLGGRLQFEVVDAAALNNAAQARMPAGAILTLVENALEHGIAPALSGGRVQVNAGATPTGGWCEVMDTGAGFDEPPTLNVGLRNTQERLRALYGDAAHLTLTRNAATATTHARITWDNATP